MLKQSDIAKMRECIDLANEAARNGLYAPAMVTRHESIIARMERATDYIKDLKDQGRHEEADALLRCDDLWEYMQRLQESSSP